MEPIRIPIEDVLDLHTFRPQDIADLLDEYFSECIKAGIPSVRVIHGKGKGIQKKQVHKILKNHPLVQSVGAFEATLTLTLTDLNKHPR
jgi:dsDNA-specific endonuclease/ATPase MutS2